MDEAPFPDYSILKTPCVAANVISTRGCPYRCTFCTTSRMFAPYRQRSVDNVIDEIRMIASIVLGLDEDTKKDMDRSVAFAKSIHAYQLQPAILTPFPGTPVYNQFCQDHRMIISDWSQFDMMNVTFLPKHMSPWKLQETFYEAFTGKELCDEPQETTLSEDFDKLTPYQNNLISSLVKELVKK